MTWQEGLGPWAGAAERLQSPLPPDMREPVEYLEGDRWVLVSEVYFPAAAYRGRPMRAFGYFARPKSLSPEGDCFPAMLLLHGGGGTADPRWARWWARRGYAALTIDLAGQGPGRQPLPDGGPAFSSETFLLTHGLENTWMYHAVATSIAGVSALASLPFVDSERMGVTGISWGGYFCATVMSIDTRLRLGIPVYGAGFNPRAANGADPTFEDGKVQRDAFDPSNFLPQCHKPVLWVTTTNDRNVQMSELQRSLRLTPGPNTLCLTPNVGHHDPRSIGLGERPEIEYFVDAVFRGGEPLLHLGEPRVEGRTLRVPVVASAAPPLAWAVAHYTTDLEKPGEERRWQSLRTTQEEDTISVTLPAGQGPLIAFINVSDERGATVASDWREVSA